MLLDWQRDRLCNSIFEQVQLLDRSKDEFELKTELDLMDDDNILEIFKLLLSIKLWIQSANCPRLVLRASLDGKSEGVNAVDAIRVLNTIARSLELEETLQNYSGAKIDLAFTISSLYYLYFILWVRVEEDCDLPSEKEIAKFFHPDVDRELQQALS